MAGEGGRGVPEKDLYAFVSGTVARKADTDRGRATGTTVKRGAATATRRRSVRENMIALLVEVEEERATDGGGGVGDDDGVWHNRVVR